MIIKNDFKKYFDELKELEEVSKEADNMELSEYDMKNVLELNDKEIKDYQEQDKKNKEELIKSLEEFKNIENDMKNFTEEDKNRLIYESNITYYLIEIDKKIQELKNKEEPDLIQIKKYLNKKELIEDSLTLNILDKEIDYFNTKIPKSIKRDTIYLIRNSKTITMNENIKYIEENINKIFNDESLVKKIKKFSRAFYYFIYNKGINKYSLYIFFITMNISNYLNNIMYEKNKEIFKKSLLKIINKF